MISGGWIRLSRWQEWAQSKLPFLTAAAFAVWSPPADAILLIGGTVSLWAAFGYALNDVADREPDEAASKPNRAAGLGTPSWVSFLLLTGGGALGMSFLWAENAVVPAIVAGGLGLAFAYSAWPVRLKERGALGLVAGAVAQWGLPVLAVCASTAEGLLEPQAWFYAFLGLAIGIRWMAVHQRHDIAADRRSNVGTYAARGGGVDRVIRRAFAAEVIFLAGMLSLVWPHSALAIGALAIWTALELTVVNARRGPLWKRLLRYEVAPLGRYYFVVLPITLAAGRLAL